MAGLSNRSSTLKWLIRNGLLVVLTLIPLAIVGKWLHYRWQYTISTRAVLQGHVIEFGSRIEGRVAEVLVQANELVQIGDVVARLEDHHLRAELHESKIRCDRVAKQIIIEECAIQQERLERANAVAHAEAELTIALSTESAAGQATGHWQRQQNRIASMRFPTAISESEKDEVLLHLQQAESSVATQQQFVTVKRLAVQAAKARLNGLKIREQKLELLQQDVKLAEASVARVLAELEATVIRSPVQGWVATRRAGPGTSLKIGDPIVSVWEEDPMWVEAWVDESRLGELEVGRNVQVHFAAHPDRKFVGQVEAIGVLSDRELETQSGFRSGTVSAALENSVSVRIGIQNVDVRLMPGLSAVVGIESTPHQESVPEKTVASAYRNANIFFARLSNGLFQ